MCVWGIVRVRVGWLGGEEVVGYMGKGCDMKFDEISRGGLWRKREFRLGFIE